MTVGIGHEIGRLEELPDDAVDRRLFPFIQGLRRAADTYDAVFVNMPPAVARLLAADLEELAMLRMVPPTGDAG